MLTRDGYEWGQTGPTLYTIENYTDIVEIPMDECFYAHQTGYIASCDLRLLTMWSRTLALDECYAKRENAEKAVKQYVEQKMRELEAASGVLASQGINLEAVPF